MAFHLGCGRGGLGYLKTLLPQRPDLKLVLSSATLEADRFSRYFDAAPVVEVSGRTYPVEVRWRPPTPPPPGEGARRAGEGTAPTITKAFSSPPTPPPGGEGGEDLEAALLDAVDELAREGPGDILVFLPGEREIRDTAEALGELTASARSGTLEVVPLYSRLSAAEQQRGFAPHASSVGRRIVLRPTSRRPR